jgi:quercetin dioxygenase-like cupin family protein
MRREPVDLREQRRDFDPGTGKPPMTLADHRFTFATPTTPCNFVGGSMRQCEGQLRSIRALASGISRPIVFGLGLAVVLAAPASAQEYTAVMERDIKWQDAPSIGPGAKTALIQGDPKSSGPFVMRLKVPPKTTIGAHTHPATENVTILSGTLYFAAGDKLDPKTAKAFGPGSYFSIDQGKPMVAYTKDKGVTLQLHGNGPWGITYLSSNEGGAKKK